MTTLISQKDFYDTRYVINDLYRCLYVLIVIYPGQDKIQLKTKMLRNEGKEGETKLAEEGKVEEDVNFGEEESRQSGKQRVKYDKSAKYDKHGKNSQANVKREKVQNEIEGGRKHAIQRDEDRWSSHDKTYGKPCCGHATPRPSNF